MAGSGSPLGINERKEIKRLLGKMSLTKIAERMNRSKNCIITEVRLNGGTENYDPKKAHERANDVQKEGRERATVLCKLKMEISHAERMIHKMYEEREKFKQTLIELEDELRRAKGMNYLLPMIQALDARIVKLEEVSYSHEPTAQVKRLMERMRKIEKRIQGFLDRVAPEKPVGNLPLAPTTGRIIKACEWHKYRNWPDHTELMKFIRLKDEYGFDKVCFKPDRYWYIDEDRFDQWEREYKEKMLAKAVKVEET